MLFSRPESALPTHLNVLFLEDSASDAELVLHELRRAGFDLHASRVEAEPDYLAHLDPTLDLILADYSLPQFDALRALHVLRERGLDIPFIIISGSISEEVAVECMKQGAADYLLKDRLARLGQAVTHALGLKQLRDEKAEAEAILRESEARYRTLVETSPDAILLMDLGGSIFVGNKQAAALYGFESVGELLGKDSFDFIAPDDRLRARAEAQQAVQTPKVRNLEYTLLRKDGSHFPAELNTSVITGSEGKPSAFIMVVRDITERKQRERRLEAIASLSAALRTAQTRAEMVPVILDQLLDLLKADGIAIAFRDLVTDETVIELARGSWMNWIGVRLASGEGVSGKVMATGQPYLNNRARSDLRLFARPDLLGDVQALACIPLNAYEQTIGALWIGRGRAGSYWPTSITEDELQLLTAVSDIAASAIRRATLHEQTEQRLQRLAALRNIDMAISASLDVRLTLNVVLDQVTMQLRVDAASVLLLDPHTQTLAYAAGRGFRGAGITRSRLRLGEGRSGAAALERRLIAIPNLREFKGESARAQLLTSEAFLAFFAVPLIAKGQVKGVLEIFHRAVLQPDPEWLEFLETLGAQAAIAIDNAALFDELQRSNAELLRAYDTTLEGWVKALDLRDKETEGHTQRVTELTLRLARALQVGDEALVHIRRGALLHDIGKMGIPDSILLKPGPLTEAEWEIMRRHPTYAYELLAPIPYHRQALDIPYCHHEKWDGSGYPRGLLEEQIPLAARLFAFADVWDALRSDRPYRQGWPEGKARDYIHEQSGRHFDPKIMDVFFNTLM